MDPRRVHQLDQETGPMHEMAVKFAAYHRSLISQGFHRSEALEIVLDYQRAIVHSVIGKGSDGR